MGHTVSREELKEKIQTDLGIYFYYPHFFKSLKEGNLCTSAINLSSYGKLPRKDDDSIVLAVDSGLDLPQQMIEKIRSLVHSEEHMMYLLDLYLADSVIDGKQVQVMYIPKSFPSKKGPRLYASTPTPKKSIEEPISIADYLLELSMIPKDTTIALPLAYHHLDEFSLVVSSEQADGSASSINKNFFDALYRRLLVKKNDVCLSLAVHSLPEFILHPNLAPLLRVVETKDSFYPVFERQPFTLDDVLKFSREVLRSESNKTLFIFYQLLNVIAFCHQRGIIHGNINPSNIILNNDAWAMLTGFTCTDLASVEGNPAPDTPPAVKWVSGELSNYEYLLEVNRLAGRRWGDPTFHPILPWVIDFKKRMSNDSSSSSSDVTATPERGSISREDETPLSPRSGVSSSTFTWRDLTKTKYRLAKGDEQLDFMYNNAGAENTPHHVPSQGPDELSYYNYKSRVTPVKLLQKWVRGRYQANEYPKDLARLYNQSPDEAIPEFYSEPQIYFDLHPLMHELRPDDLEHDVLGDLQVPDWAQSVEDFVQKHRAALESDFVTSQLHTWLDLTFGQCLAGDWGVKHKNVALVSDTHLTSHGFVKLWDAAHPRRPTAQTVSSARSLRVRQSPSIRRTPSAKKSFFEPRSTLGRIKNKLWSSDSDAAIAGEELSETVSLSATSSGNTSPAMSATSSQTSLPLPQLPALDETSDSSSLAPYMLHSDLVKQLNAGKYHMDYIEELMSCEHTEHFFQLSETLEPWYRASVPHGNTLSEADLAKSNDIFSLGCVLYELYTGTPLYNKYKLTAEDKSSTIQATSSIPPAIRDLIVDMTDPNPAHRPTAQALLVPLQATFKSAIRDIFPSYFQWLYKLLMTYHSLPSLQERLTVITDNLGEIIQMADDGFKLLMPCMLKFFDNEATQLPALKLFESLALKLGRHQSIFYLRDCIISLYERQNQAQLQLELMGFKWTQLMLSKFGPSCFIKHFLGFLLSAVRSKAPNLANTASDTVLSLMTSFSQPVYMKYFVLPLLAQTSKAYNEVTFNTLTEMVPKLRAELLAKYFFEPLMQRIVKLTSSMDIQAQPGTNESLTSTIKLLEKCFDLVDGDMCNTFLLKELEDNRMKPVIYLYTLLTTPPTCFQVTSLFKAFCSLLLIVAKKIGSSNAKKLAMPYVLKYFNTAQQAPAEAAKSDASAELVKSIYNPEVTSPLYAKFKSLIDSPSTTLDAPQPPSMPISPTALGFGLVPDDMTMSGGFENRMSWASLVSMSDKRPEFQGQTLATWREHVGAIKCLAVHDNERLFVSGSRDNMVKLWNIESMNSLITYSSHKQSITSVQFVDRGNLVASCDGNTIHIWELERGMQIMQLESEYGYSAFEPSDDGRSVIALLGNGAAVQAIELGTGRVTREWQIPTGQLGYAKTIAVYPRPYLFNAYHHSYHLRAYAAVNKSRSFSKLQTITLGHSNGVVSVWDGLSGQLIESWRAHDGPISQVLPITAQVCLTASHDRSLVLWNRSETVNFNNPSEHIPKQIKAFKGHRDPVLGCDLLGSDMLSIAGHRISCANLDTPESVVKLNRIKLHKTSTLKPNQLTTLTALPLHQLALVGTEDGLIKLCN